MSSDGQAPHLLAVNDSPEILMLLREIFDDEGFHVTTRINGETDLDEISEIAPGLVILDYSSETETGLLHRLTTDPRTEAIPVILCTGAVRAIEALKPELEMLDVAVVYKPFDIEHLVRVVRERLGLGTESEESHPPAIE